MLRSLPTPELLRWAQHDGFEPQLPVMCLRWRCDHKDAAECSWTLPEGLTIVGPPPRLFGLHVDRQDRDSYSVRLVWDRTTFAWERLSRPQLLATCLRNLLAALGTDLWHLLD